MVVWEEQNFLQQLRNENVAADSPSFKPSSFSESLSSFLLRLNIWNTEVLFFCGLWSLFYQKPDWLDYLFIYFQVNLLNDPFSGWYK